MLGMIPQRNSAVQRDPFISSTASLESNRLYQERLLINQLTSGQTTNANAPTNTMRSVLDRYASQNMLPQADLLGFRSDKPGIESTPSSNTLAFSSNILRTSSGGASNDNASLQGTENSEIIAAFLAQQQRNRNLLNSNNQTTTAAITANNASALGSTNMSRQVLQIMRNRQLISGGDINLSQAEEILQQHLQQNPSGR
jgi:hypothetical protein